MDLPKERLEDALFNIDLILEDAGYFEWRLGAGEFEDSSDERDYTLGFIQKLRRRLLEARERLAQ